MVKRATVTPDVLGEIKSFQGAKTKCSIPKLLEELAEPDREAVLIALDDDSIQSTAITRFLVSRGVNVGSHTIQRHRRQSCGCVRNG